MKAFVKRDPAATTVVPAEVPVPRVDAGELLVRIQAIGVGIHDGYFLTPTAGSEYPVGIEASGVVEQTGAGVTRFRTGDRIAFVSSMQPKGGTWAEYAVVDAAALILPMPAELSFVEAAALPVVGNTVLRAFAALGKMPAGATLFIAGGSGAIGTLAIQLARQHGWHVAASASPQNHDYMRSLGAELTVDYHQQNSVEIVRTWRAGGVDAAIAVQPTTTIDAMRTVKDNGTVVTVSADTVSPERGIRVTGLAYDADVQSGLDRLIADITEKRLHIEIERVYAFEQAPMALARVQPRHVRGKLVLQLGTEDPGRGS